MEFNDGETFRPGGFPDRNDPVGDIHHRAIAENRAPCGNMVNAMRTRLGMIAPSSNSVLESVTYAMLADAPGITAHFSRFRVTEIALDAHALDQFDPSQMLPAADLLADAKVDAVAWNGTSASWLGIERARAFVKPSLRAPESPPRRRRLPALMRYGRVGRNASAL